jgi:hypothetical protein
MIRRPPRHTPNRTRLAVQNQPPGFGIPVTTWALSTGSVLITFAAPIVLQALPTGITRQAAGTGAQLVPTAAAQPAANQLLLTYAASVVTTDVITIPAGVTQVRGTAGGFLAAASKTF